MCNGRERGGGNDDDDGGGGDDDHSSNDDSISDNNDGGDNDNHGGDYNDSGSNNGSGDGGVEHQRLMLHISSVNRVFIRDHRNISGADGALYYAVSTIEKKKPTSCLSS